MITLFLKLLLAHYIFNLLMNMHFVYKYEIEKIRL